MTPHPTSCSAWLGVLALAAALAACSRPPADTMLADARLPDPVTPATTARVAEDMHITARVNAALAQDGRLKAAQINVATRDGHVTLSGLAPDARARDRASLLARAVKGVTQVNNQLVVTRNG